MAKNTPSEKAPSKQAKRPATEPVSIIIAYDTFDLPTAQHKAGLAGLLLQIDSMRNRGKPAPDYEWDGEQPHTKVHVTFTAETVQSLFDDVYAAELVEAKVKQKWAGADLIREEEIEVEIDGKKKRVKQFVYQVIRPTLPFLKQHVTAAPELWLKLWRDMLWNIPRGNPQSRRPFEQTAAGKPCQEGSNAWKDLLRTEKAKANSEFHTAEVAGSLWIGAQATNAESVAFEGRVEQTLLLHFWPIASLVYVPQVVEPDGDSGFVGYVLAIPEIVDLRTFLDIYPDLLTNLGKDARRFRPAEAVIDLPAEGALSFLEHLGRLAKGRVAESEVHSALGSVDFIHLDKRGNNIKTLASGCVIPRRGLLEDYLGIVGRAGEKPPFANSLFRQGLMRALLNGQSWFRPFGKLFAEWPHRFFIPSEDAPRLSWFWVDARKRIQEAIQSMPADPSATPGDDDALLALVNRLVRTYLADRAKYKSGIDPGDFRENEKINWDNLPKGYYDARRSVGESLFLEFRSRRDQAFVDHFAQTLFASKQYVSEDQFMEIGRALLHRPEDVKALTLMALSANS